MAYVSEPGPGDATPTAYGAPVVRANLRTRESNGLGLDWIDAPHTPEDRGFGLVQNGTLVSTMEAVGFRPPRQA